jgi:hypothetical protein
MSVSDPYYRAHEASDRAAKPGANVSADSTPEYGADPIPDEHAFARAQQTTHAAALGCKDQPVRLGDFLRYLRSGHSQAPTTPPSFMPTQTPSVFPSLLPTELPSVRPTREPTFRPTLLPTGGPSRAPSRTPTTAPSLHPR